MDVTLTAHVLIVKSLMCLNERERESQKKTQAAGIRMLCSCANNKRPYNIHYRQQLRTNHAYAIKNNLPSSALKP